MHMDKQMYNCMVELVKKKKTLKNRAEELGWS